MKKLNFKIINKIIKKLNMFELEKKKNCKHIEIKSLMYENKNPNMKKK